MARRIASIESRDSGVPEVHRCFESQCRISRHAKILEQLQKRGGEFLWIVCESRASEMNISADLGKVWHELIVNGGWVTLVLGEAPMARSSLRWLRCGG